jgi:hypothetical protein
MSAGTTGPSVFFVPPALQYDALSGFVYPPNALTNPSAAKLQSYTWNIITASSACDAKLPAPATGKVCGVRITNGSTNLFTLNPNGSEHIQPGALASRIMWAGESAILVSDGTDWYKVAGLTIPMACRLKAAASQNLTATAFTQITLGTTDLDNTGLMATGSSTITIKRTGEYVLGVYAIASGPINAAQTVIHSIYKAGAEWRRLFRGPVDAVFSGGGSAIIKESVTAADALTMETYVGTCTGTPVTEYIAGTSQSTMSAVEVPSW